MIENHIISQKKEKSNQTVLKQKFLKNFIKKGFKIIKPLPLNYDGDNSVAFTGATINVYKNSLIAGLLDNTICNQECIRLQNLENLENKNPAFLSNFTMLGFTTKPDYLELKTALELLKTYLEQNYTTKVLYFKPSGLIGLDSKLRESGFAALNVNNEYQWKYGLEGISGTGVGLSNIEGEEYGNIVAIFRENNLIGFEGGFGLETLMARSSNNSPFDNSIKLNQLKQQFPLESRIKLDLRSLKERLQRLGVGVRDKKYRRKRILAKIKKNLEELN